MMVCKTCFAEDVIASGVVAMTLTRSTSTIQAWVCDRCREKGRITRATCRTFSRLVSPLDENSDLDSHES